MNYEDNTKEAVLSIITQAQPIPAALLAFQAERDCGCVIFPDDVAAIADELRLEGQLIVEVAAGYKIAESYQEVRAWARESVAPQIDRLHQILETMEERAFIKFLS